MEKEEEEERNEFTNYSHLLYQLVFIHRHYQSNVNITVPEWVQL